MTIFGGSENTNTSTSERLGESTEILAAEEEIAVVDTPRFERMMETIIILSTTLVIIKCNSLFERKNQVKNSK